MFNNIPPPAPAMPNICKALKAVLLSRCTQKRFSEICCLGINLTPQHHLNNILEKYNIFIQKTLVEFNYL
ncbi:hypothetical protein GCM10009124_33220 [Shewanella xiamenensis]|nr:hypothetical protein GCM10009124_33220 [Shewanella xiamenensis]